VSVTGVQGEERHDFTRAESAQIRARSLRLLGSLLRPVRWQVVAAMLVVVVSTAAQVAGPALIAFGIDRGLPALLAQDWMPLAATGAVYLVTGIIGALLIAWYTVMSARISQDVLIDLRKRVFLHTQKLSLEFHESYTSGRIISRQTSDLDAIRELLDSGINQLVQGVLYMVFTAIALISLDWQSGLVLFAALVPLMALTRWFQLRSQTLFRQSRVASASLIVCNKLYREIYELPEELTRPATTLADIVRHHGRQAAMIRRNSKSRASGSSTTSQSWHGESRSRIRSSSRAAASSWSATSLSLVADGLIFKRT